MLAQSAAVHSRRFCWESECRAHPRSVRFRLILMNKPGDGHVVVPKDTGCQDMDVNCGIGTELDSSQRIRKILEIPPIFSRTSWVAPACPLLPGDTSHSNEIGYYNKKQVGRIWCGDERALQDIVQPQRRREALPICYNYYN